MVSSPVFERIVKVCGLSEVLGPGIVRRALADVDAAPETATIEDWRRVLPHIEKRLRLYLPEAEVAQRMRSIDLLVEGAQDGMLTPNPDRPRTTSSAPPSVTTPNPD